MKAENYYYLLTPDLRKHLTSVASLTTLYKLILIKVFVLACADQQLKVIILILLSLFQKIYMSSAGNNGALIVKNAPNFTSTIQIRIWIVTLTLPKKIFLFPALCPQQSTVTSSNLVTSKMSFFSQEISTQKRIVYQVFRSHTDIFYDEKFDFSFLSKFPFTDK